MCIILYCLSITLLYGHSSFRGSGVNFKFPTKCLSDLGCFETGPPFYHPIFRPLFLLPFDEENIPTKFLLFTRISPNIPELLDHTSSTIRRSSFNPYCPTKILIHGFSVNPTKSEEYSIMKNIILQKGWHNVIVVDWSDSNRAPYFQAIANGRVVGAQTARLINALQQFTGTTPEKFHIIGHSLGAAVAGWAGERLQNLGRITGLDPAGMYFYNSPPEVKLDKTDANFVDVIITNGGTNFQEGIGTLEPLGHVNFYPNGGRVQPGCFNSSKELKDFDFNRNLCSHMRSVQLFAASIMNGYCRFTGIPCEDHDSFLSGKCSERFWWRSMFDYSPYSNTVEMGFNARKPQSLHYFPTGLKYYLETSAELPFCAENIGHRAYRPFVKY